MKYIRLHCVYYPFMFESWPMLIDKEPRKKEHRMAHTHPRAKTTYMTNPKMFKRDTPEYITLHTISCYSIIFEPYQSSQTYMLRKQSNAWQTHI